MKQTAVETIISEFNKELEVAIQIGNESKIRIIKHLINIATSYLPMEKEQIIDAYRHGFTEGTCFGATTIYKFITAEEYYTSTYGRKS